MTDTSTLPSFLGVEATIILTFTSHDGITARELLGD